MSSIKIDGSGKALHFKGFIDFIRGVINIDLSHF